MTKWLLGIGLAVIGLVVAGVLVVQSIDFSDTGVLGGDCACGDRAASWSPDGKLIVYAHNDRNKDARLYAISPAGGKARRLTGDGSDDGPVWSPNGSRIAFVHSESHPSDLFGSESSSYVEVMDAGGGTARRLAPNDGSYGLAWSPDGKVVAYEDEDGRLHSIDAGGGSRLAFERPGSRGVPRTVDSFDWSPRGHVLVYSSGGQIYFTTADGRLRWKDFKSRDVQSVDWSPDGTRLAFATSNASYEMGVDGRRPKRLGEESSSVPAWSRTGARLAWVVDGVAVVVADRDGRRRRRLDLRGGYPIGVPEWSPDGKSLVVSATPAGGSYEEGETRLFVVPVAHPERARQLT
jgi:Tol biopolymer transport system component